MYKRIMPDYKNGKIYMLLDLTNENVYYGSTCSTLSIRKQGHKDSYKGYIIGKKTKTISSFDIMKNNNYKIILVENYPCESNIELRKREQFYISNNKCINQKNAYMSKEERNKQGRVLDKKRTRNHKPYLRQYREYQITWGGSMNSYECNLLRINLDIFKI